jgi:hypothetical protein
MKPMARIAAILFAAALAGGPGIASAQGEGKGHTDIYGFVMT